jgi:hypothetical protein
MKALYARQLPRKPSMRIINIGPPGSSFLYKALTMQIQSLHRSH